MKFALDEDQQQLQAIARELLRDRSSSERVRAAMESERGWEPRVWKELVEEQGWVALTVPEALGGWGFGFVEQLVIFEEAGRAMLCAPLLSSTMAANALVYGGSEDQQRRWLPGLTEGAVTATACWQGAVTARRDGDGYLLDGLAPQALDGATAELLLIPASTQAARHFFLVPADTPGLTVTPLSTLDATRRRADLRLDGVRLDAGARLPTACLDRVLDLARVALAAEQLGGAEACLELAVDYALVREQFGRPIGSFQAIKHKCADMLLLVESARSAAWYAAWVAQNRPSELPVAAAVAQAYCSEAFFRCAAENIQIHGGIGFTWEHDAHLYFKRARASAELFGSARQHRDTIAEHIGIGGT